MIDKNYMKEISSKEGFELSEHQLNQLDKYAELLVDWNTKINLTGITEPNEIAMKHFLDSFLLSKGYELSIGESIPKNSTLIDVGTGAGFPAIPMKILRDDIQITLLDSLNKRINFLNEVTNTIKVDSIAIHGRAEEVAHKSEYREKYDIATARAVAKLSELCEYCLPFVKVGGYFIALKGRDIEEEVSQSQNAIKTIGGSLVKIQQFTLGDDMNREIVVIKKISQTNVKYPRNGGQMKKKPL